jgi:hypothetical protein
MPEPAEQQLSPGRIKALAIPAKRQTEEGKGQEEHQPQPIFAAPGKEISPKRHSVKFYFTKFTFLFTIEILEAPGYPSNIAVSKGQEMETRNRRVLSPPSSSW